MNEACIQNYFSFDGKIFLLTGGMGNVGRLIAKNILELGGHVIVSDKLSENYSSDLTILKETYLNKFSFFECNLEDQESRNNLIQDISKNFPSIDSFIHCAAFVGDSKLEGWVDNYANQSVETWERALNVNLTSAFDLTKQISSLLLNSNSPSVIYISSIYSFLAPDFKIYEDTSMGNPAAYSVSKAGLNQLTKWFATALAPKIRVNSISPGGIKRNQPDIFQKRYIEKTPLKRMCKEEDIVGGVLFLSSGLSTYITGHNLVIDGGFSIW